MLFTITQSVQNTYSIFKMKELDLPELVSLCLSVQYANVHMYRNLTTLLCKVYLSRLPQPVCFVLRCSQSEFCTEVEGLLKHPLHILHQQFSPIILCSHMRENSRSPDQNVVGSNFFFYYSMNIHLTFQPSVTTLNLVLISDVSLTNCSVQYHCTYI